MTWQNIFNYSVYSGLGNKRYNSRLGNIKSYCTRPLEWPDTSLSLCIEPSSHTSSGTLGNSFIIIHQTAIIKNYEHRIYFQMGVYKGKTSKDCILQALSTRSCIYEYLQFA